MGQYEFSKGVMEKILRRAFLDGVIELYENSPFGRIHSVALEGDLLLTINKYETFDIRLFEIAQRAPEKNLAIKMLKSETALKTEDIKPNIKIESNTVTSLVDKHVFHSVESSSTDKDAKNKTTPTEHAVSVSKINVPNIMRVVAVSTDDVGLVNSENESPKTDQEIGLCAKRDLETSVCAKTQLKTSPCAKIDQETSVSGKAELETSPCAKIDQETSVSGKPELETSLCAKPVYIYDDAKDDGSEKNVTYDDNSTEVKSKTSELEDFQDDDLECELIGTTSGSTSKECETILIDDEEEIVVKRVPDIVSESKIKRRRIDPKHNVPKRFGSRSVDDCDSSSSSADNFYSACPLCSALFRNSDCFIMHIETHRQQLGQSCLICSQGNLQTEGYLYHLATHHGTSLIQAAADLSGLGREGLASSSSRQPQFPVVTSEGEFRCLQCGRDFMTIDMLENHAETHRQEELEAEREEAQRAKMLQSKEMSYSCELCSEVFSYPGSLADHHRQEHGLDSKGQMSMYVNDHTDDSSSEEAAVVNHKNKDIFICHRCSRSFRSWRSLKYHYLSTHGLQYTCEICRNAFSSLRHLQMHEQTHVSTSSDPVFKCSICDKTFPSMTHCTAHKRSHTSAKPHTCDLCGSCFFKRGDLTKHVRTVHCPKKHFVCKICGRTGTRSDNMRVHVKLHQKFMSRDQVDQLIEEVYNK